MRTEPFQALQAAARPAARVAAGEVAVVAGATGALGSEMLRQLAGSGRYARVDVLAREPITEGVRTVACVVVPPEPGAGWPLLAARTGVILFDPPRLFYQRERALWTPRPGQLKAVATWMRSCGVLTLAVVLPHAQGRLPEPLKRGLATLDEHAVAALGFERVLFVRSAEKPGARLHRNFLERVAHWMLSVLGYMVPSSEQPVRASKVAQLVALALQQAPAGIHVAAPELVWRAAQGNLRAVAAEWLRR